MDKKYVIGIVLFLGVFGFYLYSAAPAAAPYRDAGEMVTAGSHLGIAHPPGYPLYILCGNLCIRILPFGTNAYRMNIMSALCLAAGVAFMYLVILCIAPCWKSGGAALAFVLGSGGGFWYIAQVSEMYAATMLSCSILLFLAVRLKDRRFIMRDIYVIAFLGGLFLGFRLDLMLVFPGIILILAPYVFKRKTGLAKIVACSGIFFAAGLSVYLYLYFRAGNDPLMNWGNPDTLAKLFNVLSRKTHGHTLDLLSTNYRTGELFFPELWIYAKDLFWQFSPCGIPLIIAGAYALFQKDQWLFAGLTVAFIVSGPVFIFLGNMPPNPHALAIMEPHYVLPNVFLFCFLAAAGGNLHASHVRAWIAAALVMIALNFVHYHPRFMMRNNFFAEDYVSNIFRSLPYEGLAVVKEDVQLFSVWDAQYNRGKRAQTPVAAQGLAGSEWYIRNMKRMYPAIRLLRLQNADQWKTLIASNPGQSVFISGDTEFPGSPDIKRTPHGLLTRLSLKKDESNPDVSLHDLHKAEILMKEIIVRRGAYDYRLQYEKYLNFFNADLIEEYASAWSDLGFRFLQKKEYDRAEQAFMRSIKLKDITPIVYYHLAYLYFDQEAFENARIRYRHAVERYRYYLELARQYHSLPSLVSGIRAEFAHVYLHLGVVEEKLGNEGLAEENFKKAVDMNPSFSQAYFNISTLYWKRGDWEKVIYYLEQALRLDPHNAALKQYLEKAKNNGV